MTTVDCTTYILDSSRVSFKLWWTHGTLQRLGTRHAVACHLPCSKSRFASNLRLPRAHLAIGLGEQTVTCSSCFESLLE